jgi:hypothetical protein
MSCLRKSLIGLGFAGMFWAAGCGTPGAPQPPSLNLPELVQDLSVNRVGDEIHLHWTMSRRNTDRLQLKGQYTAHLCIEESAGKCSPVADVVLPAASQGDYRYNLPSVDRSGPLRPLTYRVELKNHAGHSAGLSNPANTLGGVAPLQVLGLTAKVQADGVVFHWTPAADEIVRLHRVLLSPPVSQKKEGSSLLNDSGPELIEQNFLVRPKNGIDPGEALEMTAILDRKYRYMAERIRQQKVQDKAVEIASVPSEWITVDTRDIFPPVIPTGLVAVVVPEEKSIDLSWVANTDRDLAGYFVYRSEHAKSPIRISPAQPIPAPSFRDTSVQSGHHYFYSVSAVDRAGNESARTEEIEEVYP